MNKNFFRRRKKDESDGATRIGIDPIRDVRQISLPRTLLLGLQHAFAMFGATVLVPILTGLEISTALLMAGLGTLVFHLITRGKVPAFLGSSFAFIVGYNTVAPFVNGNSPNPEQLAKANGGVVIAGLVYLVLALFIKLFGVRRVMRFFPPVVTGPIIISIGLILAPVAINSASQNWLLAVVALLVIVICNIWGRGMVKIIPIIIGITVSYVLALILNQVDFSQVSKAGLFALPLNTATFAKFDLSAILTIVPISLATMMEHVGDITSISATTGNNYLVNPGLHRTLIGDGVATSFSAMFGGPANTTYGENTGVLVLTKVYDPRVMQIAAVIAVVLSFFPAISAVIQSIPAAIIGGVSLVLYGMISAIGVRNVVENKVDFTRSRNLLIAAIILVTALGFSFSEAGGLVFKVGEYTITISGLALASILGIIMNAILPEKDYVFTEDEPKDTGVDFSGTDSKPLRSSRK
ncbi:MAG: uracil-xanthine permease [Clostridiaceae bacterium]|nr:uracil-xanthine permease [Clostridiaceae bacterium]